LLLKVRAGLFKICLVTFKIDIAMFSAAQAQLQKVKRNLALVRWEMEGMMNLFSKMSTSEPKPSSCSISEPACACSLL